MARAYSDDLRRRILQAYEQGEGSEARLAQRFRVSLSYVKKIRRQMRHSGKMERVPHHPGRKPKFTEPVRQQLRRQARLQVSLPSLWTVMGKIGLRLKKVTSRARARHGSQPATAPSLPRN